MVYISNRKELLDYCKNNNIRPQDFNEPVTLNPDFDNLFIYENSSEYLLDDEAYAKHSQDVWDYDDAFTDYYKYDPDNGFSMTLGFYLRKKKRAL